MKQKVIPILQETPTIERNVLPKMGFLREPKFKGSKLGLSIWLMNSFLYVLSKFYFL